MRESSLEQSSVRREKRRGWNSIKIGVNGWPDRQFRQRRVYVWVEYKVRPNKPTTLQAKRIRELIDEGEFVHVCYSADEVTAALDSHSWWLNDRGFVDTQGL
jgi:hypothetical protein